MRALRFGLDVGASAAWKKRPDALAERKLAYVKFGRGQESNLAYGVGSEKSIVSVGLVKSQRSKAQRA